MLGHKLILLGATTIATGLYGGIYMIANDIYLIKANASRDIIERRFEVDLTHYVPSKPFAKELAFGSDLQPVNTLTELLDRETEPMPELNAIPIEPVEIPELQDRLDDNNSVREHDFDIDESVFQGIDAQIIEIAEQHARKNIDIPRRLVKPSSTRVLASNERPVFRGAENGILGGAPVQLPRSVDVIDELIQAIKETKPQASDQQFDENNEIAEVITPLEDEADIFHPDFLEPEKTFLPEDTVLVARNTVQQKIKQESTFDSMDALVKPVVTTYIDPTTQQGYFELKIVPDATQVIPSLPRDITFVIDASNSIIPRKLQLTIRGVKTCLDMLQPEDHFNIIIFRGTPKLLSPTNIPATPSAVIEAKEFLEGLESKGATDVYNAIKPVIQNPPRRGVPGIVIVLTDGRPTDGNLKGRQLINALSDENLLGNTFYTFGGGKTVNQYLLDLLAYRNKGRSFTFPQIEDIDDRLPEFFAQLNDAYLVHLQADFGRIDKNTVFPRNLPDFYKGQVVTLYGRYTPTENDDLLIRLQGHSGQRDQGMLLKVDLKNAQRGDITIVQNWAFQKIYHLIGEVSRYGETPELMAEIRRLSQKHNIRNIYHTN